MNKTLEYKNITIDIFKECLKFIRISIVLTLTSLIACGEKLTDTGSETESETTVEETEENTSIEFQSGVSTISGSGE